MTDLKTKIAAIVARRLPKGYRVIEHKDPHGGGVATGGRRKVIRCPPLEDRYALGVFLHEVGHVELGHLRGHHDTNWRDEYEAEKWAMSAMQAEGIPVPDSYKSNARHNVRTHIEGAQSKDPDVEIDEEILKFAFPDTWKEAA